MSLQNVTRNFSADYDLLAVSAFAQQTALDTFQTLDLSLLVDKNTVLDVAPRIETNKD
ncbi:MAG: hypothetical protein HGA78_01160 [Nitrospirales bacterium]|nr:hypothetical protein [Nitrospirales bacterium]